VVRGDALLKLLGWGIGLLLVFTGWLISINEVFERWNDQAIGLVIIAPIVYALWVFTVRWCYSKCPRHRTVLPARYVRIFLATYGLVMAFLVVLALD
jgi:hypothetical protein